MIFLFLDVKIRLILTTKFPSSVGTINQQVEVREVVFESDNLVKK
jgi:hypothetical protein